MYNFQQCWNAACYCPTLMPSNVTIKLHFRNEKWYYMPWTILQQHQYTVYTKLDWLIIFLPKSKPFKNTPKLTLKTKRDTFKMFTADEQFCIANSVSFHEYHLKPVRHYKETKDVPQQRRLWRATDNWKVASHSL